MLLCLGFAAALLASEALLRTAYLSAGQFVLDPVLGVDRVPHSEVFVAREGGARLRFDRYGLNNDDAVWGRSGPRLALLGDSYTEAAEVPRAENTVSRLAATFPDWVVLNLGRAALTPPQAVELYRRMAARERIDILLLQLSDNDLAELEGQADLGPDCRLPSHPPGWRKRLTAALVSHSALLMRLQLRVRDWWDELGQPGAGQAAPAAPAEAAAPDPALVVRLAGCLRVLAEQQPLVVTVLPDASLPLTEAQQAADRARRAIYVEAARQAGAVAVIDAWGEFGVDPLGDGRLVNGFPNGTLGYGHLNVLGHARLAEVLAQPLRALLRGEEAMPQLVVRAGP